MREFTKSMFSFSWAMSLFGVQQMGNLFTGGNQDQPNRATSAFDRVSCATEDQLGESLRETFRAGDKMQRSMVDAMFNLMMLRPLRGDGMTGQAEDGMDTWTGCCGGDNRQAGDDGMGPQGWGPVPPPEGG